MPESRPILVLGSRGQVGRELPAALAGLGPVVALDRTEANLEDPESLRAAVATYGPSVVVNAAAYTAVDRAESERALAESVNAVAPGVLAEAAERVGAMVVHYSTDYVFDGTSDRPYVESDPPAPLSVYGATKWRGELAVSAAARRHVILRTSWVYGIHGANFPRTMLRLATERVELRVVSDQVGAPTAAARIAEVTATVVAQLRGASAQDARWGTYHLAAAGATTWHGIAERVIARARARGVSLRLQGAIVAIPTSEYPTPARRPANSRLDSARLCNTFRVTMPDWRNDLDDVVDALTLPPSA